MYMWLRRLSRTDRALLNPRQAQSGQRGLHGNQLVQDLKTLVKLALASLQPEDYASVGLKPSCTIANHVFLWTACLNHTQTTTNTEHIRTLRTPIPSFCFPQ